MKCPGVTNKILQQIDSNGDITESTNFVVEHSGILRGMVFCAGGGSADIRMVDVDTDAITLGGITYLSPDIQILQTSFAIPVVAGTALQAFVTNGSTIRGLVVLEAKY